MTLSVVIPAYNVEGFIGEAIRSVIDQSESPDEIVVVDDGSTDGTAGIAESFEEVRVVRKSNGGLASARNAGAKSSTGELIFFLDADDALLPGGLAIARRELARHPDAGILIPNFELWRDGRHIGFGWPPSSTRVLSERDVPSLIRRNWLLSQSLMTRKVWDTVRYREELRQAEDLDFWLRALLAGITIVVSPFAGLRYTVARGGSLSTQLVEMRAARRNVFEGIWARKDLTARARIATGYGLVRASVGEIGAYAAAHQDVAGRLTGLKSSSNRVVRMVGQVLGLHPVIARSLASMGGSKRFGADHPGT